MHFKKIENVCITIFLIGLTSKYLPAGAADETVELTCLDTLQCKQFENSTCVNNVCVCTDASTGKEANCIPKDDKQSNEIGGKCPCSQPSAVCKTSENRCYCNEHFTASRDRRRCIPELVRLDGDCEIDIQCHSADPYAVCKSNKCVCRESFQALDGACISVVDASINCSNYTDCKALGNGVVCAMDLHECICADGYVKAGSEKKCLRTLKYKEKCVESVQCQKRLGPGGVCNDEACQCAEKYYALPPRADAIKSQLSNYIEDGTVCKRIVGLHEYCNYDTDCYQSNKNEEGEFTVACIFGECICKPGYYSINDLDCIKGSGGGTFGASLVPQLLAAFIALSIYIAF